jgi:sulfur-oxidizing protein SoxY
MNTRRRHFLLAGLAALATAALWPLRALADALESAFKAKSVDEVHAAIGGKPEASDQIELMTPDIAENGAVVPVSVTSKLPGTEQILIMVEKNPNPLAASFTLPEGTEAFASTRVKVAQTCNIHALVKADGKFYGTQRETKVTLGGCGG